VINSTNPDIGESKEDMKLAYKGDPMEVMYNPKFFIDTLGVLDEDNIVLNIVDDQNS
jgi:DNA polymerase-3 subunit beta